MEGRRNLEVFTENKDDKEQQEAAKDVKSSLKRGYHHFFAESEDFREFIKNKEEKKICRDAILAAKLALEELKLKKFADHIEIEPDNIHILSKEDFERIGSPDSGGFHRLENTYAPVNDNILKFIHVITHELSHAISYYALNLEKEKGENSHTGLKYNDFALISKRSGLDFTKENGELIFQGLAEATTELLADRIRQQFVKLNKNLPMRKKKDLVESHVYYPQILIVNHITGSYSWLNNAEIKIPGVTKILAEMGTEPEDAVEASKKLGFKDLTEYLEAERGKQGEG